MKAEEFADKLQKLLQEGAAADVSFALTGVVITNKDKNKVASSNIVGVNGNERDLGPAVVDVMKTAYEDKQLGYMFRRASKEALVKTAAIKTEGNPIKDLLDSIFNAASEKCDCEGCKKRRAANHG